MPEKLTTERLREIVVHVSYDEDCWRVPHTEVIAMARELLALRAHGEAAPVMSCPHCGDPFAWVTEPEPDFHAGATYTCNKCGGAVIATFQTPEQYAAPPPEARGVRELLDALADTCDEPVRDYRGAPQPCATIDGGAHGDYCKTCWFVREQRAQRGGEASPSIPECGEHEPYCNGGAYCCCVNCCPDCQGGE